MSSDYSIKRDKLFRNISRISRRENETGAKNGLNYETIAFESIERRNGRGRITYIYIYHVDDTK